MADLLVKNYRIPTCCAKCDFRGTPEYLTDDECGSELVSRCKLAPEEIEDPWRPLWWQWDNKEVWCPLFEVK